MQKSKKIAIYLEKHPRATEEDVRRKFGLSRKEALELLRGNASMVEVSRSGAWQSIRLFLLSLVATEKKTLLALFFLGLSIRAIYASVLFRHPLLLTPLHDAAYYLAWGKQLLAYGWLGDTIFFTEPFYAYLIAGFLFLFHGAGPTALLLLQFFLGALLSVALYLLTKTLLHRKAALWAGFLTALYGPFLFYEGLLLKTSLEVFLLPWLILLFFVTFRKRQMTWFFGAGLLLGALVLVKGNNLIFWFIISFLILFLLRDLSLLRRALFVLVFSGGVFVCILPITVRNMIVGHDIVFTNYSFGLVIYQGSWWGGDGSTARVPHFLRPDPRYEETDAVGMAEAYAGKKLKPSEVSRFWIEKTVEEALAAPGHFVGTIWNKIFLVANYSEFSDNYQFGFYRSTIPFLWILPNFLFVGSLGLLGLFLFFREVFWQDVMMKKNTVSQAAIRDQKIIFLSLFFGAILVLLLTTVNARYRVALVPFFLVLSGGALSFFWSLWEERESKKMVSLGWLLGGVFLVVAFPLASLKHDTDTDAYHALGFAALEQGRYDDAENLFQKTIARDQEYAWAYGNLMLTELALGNYGAAEQALKTLIVLRPDDLSNYERLVLLRRLQGASRDEMRRSVVDYLATTKTPDYDADFNEAERYLAENDDTQAEDYLLRSLKQHERSTATLVALATLKKRQNALPQAKQYLNQAVEFHPEVFPARYNLANIFIEEKNFNRVAELLQDIYVFTPELGETWYNYAVALIKINKTTEAVPVIQAYIDRYQDDVSRKEKVEKFKAALKPVSPDVSNLLQQGKQ